jgi:hypothetical protein
MILAAAASRLLPHPPNVAPITALALFAGAHFQRKWLAFLVPLAAILLSDLVLGLHPLVPVVYGSFALITCIGFWLRRQRTTARIVTASLVGSVLFFAVTNFACWLLWYPRSLEGLVACYVAAIPFFRNTLLGDAAYTAVLFAGLALAEKGLPVLREPAVALSK